MLAGGAVGSALVGDRKSGAIDRHGGFCLTHASDIFIDIARRFDVGYVGFRAANSDVDPWLPGEERDHERHTLRYLHDSMTKEPTETIP